ncbi:hypothetical protein RRG08_063457 [Elysia crispata]|uniref:Uncharacterized protein n=1 Tax=Elysia crispata TaxID=231223 RepID=A0AAE1DUR0_9GAST|nr:hypothetical protein RRG08_063457 [Elysia crispata]
MDRREMDHGSNQLSFVRSRKCSQDEDVSHVGWACMLVVRISKGVGRRHCESTLRRTPGNNVCIVVAAVSSFPATLDSGHYPIVSTTLALGSSLSNRPGRDTMRDDDPRGIS